MNVNGSWDFRDIFLKSILKTSTFLAHFASTPTRQPGGRPPIYPRALKTSPSPGRANDPVLFFTPRDRRIPETIRKWPRNSSTTGSASVQHAANSWDSLPSLRDDDFMGTLCSRAMATKRSSECGGLFARNLLLAGLFATVENRNGTTNAFDGKPKGGIPGVAGNRNRCGRELGRRDPSRLELSEDLIATHHDQRAPIRKLRPEALESYPLLKPWTCVDTAGLSFVQTPGSIEVFRERIRYATRHHKSSSLFSQEKRTRS